jgi:hypothetical protein
VITAGINLANHYELFGCSSAAAPHVAGVAALLMGYIKEEGSNVPNVLAPEDVEQIIQRTAQDRSLLPLNQYDPNTVTPNLIPNYSPPYPGYDEFSGWGMPDARAAIEAIVYPNYLVKHIRARQEDNPIETQLLNNATFSVTQTLKIYNQALPAGEYKVDVWQVDFPISYLNEVPPHYSIIDGWGLNALSEGWGDYTSGPSYAIPLRPLTKVDWNNPNWTSGSVTGTTYFYHLKERQIGGTWTAFDQWYPTHKDQAKVGFSLYLGQTTDIGEEQHVNQLSLQVWPNPAQNQVNLQFESLQREDVQITLHNLTGKVVYVDQVAAKIGQNQAGIPLSGLSSGLYLLRVQTNAGMGIRPLIVQH